MFRWDSLERIIPGFSEMGLVSPLMLLSGGIACWLLGRDDAGNLRPAQRCVAAACVCMLTIFPALMLFEQLSGIAVGVDFRHSDELATAFRQYPGRMSPNAALGFLLASGVLWLIQMRPTLGKSRATAALIAGIAVIGAAGGVGYFLHLERLYPITAGSRLTPPMAFGLVLFSVALWLLHERWQNKVTTVAEHEKRITRRLLGVLACMLITGIIGGFALVQNSFEEARSDSLRFIATTTAESLVQSLRANASFSSTMARLPAVGKALEGLNTAPRDASNLEFLRQVAKNSVTAGLSGVRLLDAGGAEVATVGGWVSAEPETVLELATPLSGSRLVWHKGFFLRSNYSVFEQGKEVGRVVTELPMPLFDRLTNRIHQLSANSDLLICSRVGDVASCLPSRFYLAPLKIPMFDANGYPTLPINRALLGQQGTSIVTDLRGIPVFAAYAPLKDTGLALVVKDNAATLEAPLRKNLDILALLLVALVGAGWLGLRKQVQPLVAQLAAEHNQLVTSQSVAKMGSWSTDLVSAKVEWSSGMHSIFETDPALFKPTIEEFFNRLHPDDVAEVERAFVRSADLEGIQMMEYRIVLPSGAVKVLEERWQVSFNRQGVVVGALGTRQDITERRRDKDALRDLNADLELRVQARTSELTLSREEAEQANQAKSGFLASISHELRTPMSGLLGLMELMAMDKLTREQHETVAIARDSGIALLRIIDDLLDFSKIEAERLELDPAAASVAQVVERSCQLHKRIASSKDLTLACEVDPLISPLLSFDAVRLGQILNNFLNNAIKFTERGRVDLRVDLVGRAADADELRFTVTDTGIGITPEQLGRLFQPFVQAAPGTSTRFGGTGLGLVISRRLAQLMGGVVDIQSEPGRGTTLTLTVAFTVCDEEPEIDHSGPQLLDARLVSRRPPPAVQQAEQEGTLLLVVDDHPTNRLLMLRQVASLGYAAETAEDGDQALAAWKSGRFAAVITDCNMPKMDGYELTAAIRSAEERTGARRTPIIGCTANAMREAAERCLSAGMDDLLIKPAGLMEVSQKLDLWVPVPLAHFDRISTVPASLHPARKNADAPVSETQGTIDLLLLSEISGGNRQIQQDILAEFQRINEQDAAALRQAVLESDFKGVMQFSHRIKGSTLTLGATRLAAACEKLEMATPERSGSLQAMMMVFEAELARLNQFIGDRSAAR